MHIYIKKNIKINACVLWILRFSELNLQKDIKNDKIRLDLGENSPKSNLEKKK